MEESVWVGNMNKWVSIVVSKERGWRGWGASLFEDKVILFCAGRMCQDLTRPKTARSLADTNFIDTVGTLAWRKTDGGWRFHEATAALVPHHRLGLVRTDVGRYAKRVLVFFEVLPLSDIVMAFFGSVSFANIGSEGWMTVADPHSLIGSGLGFTLNESM